MTSKDILSNNIRSPLYVGGNYNPFLKEVKSPLINVQKNLFKVSSINFKDGIYNIRKVFEIPKDIGHLSQIFIKSQVTCTGDNTDVQDRLGSRIYKHIFLETIRGPNKIIEIRPDYTNARVDGITNQVLFDTVSQSLEPDTTSFNNTTITTYTPLFLPFENHSLSLLTNFVERLQITAITNDSYNLMGLPSDTVTNITSELLIVSYTLENYVYKSFRVPYYNVFYEPSVELSTSSTSASLTLDCNKQVFNICMVIRNTNQEYFAINNFKLTSGGQDLIPVYDRRINYELKDGGSTDNNSTGTFCYWTTCTKDRTLVFGSGLNLRDLEPLVLTVEYDTIGAGYSLYVFYEYNTILNVSSTGSLQLFDQF